MDSVTLRYASFHCFPASSVCQADSSKSRRRPISAALSRYPARSRGDVSDHAGKAFCAAAMAASISRVPAWQTRPMISSRPRGIQGIGEVLGGDFFAVDEEGIGSSQVSPDLRDGLYIGVARLGACPVRKGLVGERGCMLFGNFLGFFRPSTLHSPTLYFFFAAGQPRVREQAIRVGALDKGQAQEGPVGGVFEETADETPCRAATRRNGQ